MGERNLPGHQRPFGLPNLEPHGVGGSGGDDIYTTAQRSGISGEGLQVPYIRESLSLLNATDRLHRGLNAILARNNHELIDGTIDTLIPQLSERLTQVSGILSAVSLTIEARLQGRRIDEAGYIQALNPTANSLGLRIVQGRESEDLSLTVYQHIETHIKANGQAEDNVVTFSRGTRLIHEKIIPRDMLFFTERTPHETIRHYKRPYAQPDHSPDIPEGIKRYTVKEAKASPDLDATILWTRFFPHGELASDPLIHELTTIIHSVEALLSQTTNKDQTLKWIEEHYLLRAASGILRRGIRIDREHEIAYYGNPYNTAELLQAALVDNDLHLEPILPEATQVIEPDGVGGDGGKGGFRLLPGNTPLGEPITRRPTEQGQPTLGEEINAYLNERARLRAEGILPLVEGKRPIITLADAISIDLLEFILELDISNHPENTAKWRSVNRIRWGFNALAFGRMSHAIQERVTLGYEFGQGFFRNHPQMLEDTGRLSGEETAILAEQLQKVGLPFTPRPAGITIPVAPTIEAMRKIVGGEPLWEIPAPGEVPDDISRYRDRRR